MDRNGEKGGIEGSAVDKEEIVGKKRKDGIKIKNGVKRRKDNKE